MTMLMHRFSDRLAYDDQLQQTEMDYLFSSDAARRQLAENYVGLPF
jgi:p-hydroxybenzoate 3-monooxygenase